MIASSNAVMDQALGRAAAAGLMMDAAWRLQQIQKHLESGYAPDAVMQSRLMIISGLGAGIAGLGRQAGLGLVEIYWRSVWSLQGEMEGWIGRD